MKRTLLTILTLCATYFASSVAHAQHSVQFMAARPSWADQEWLGHAFMVISTRVGNGSKEDAFGFYPHPSYPSRAIIGGPSGAVSSEFVKDPSRFSRVTVSMQRPISDAQRRTILNHIDQWNARDYKLTSESCIDFVDSLARRLGWNTPERNSTDLPETYLRRLRAANEHSLVGTWTWTPRDQIVTIKPNGTATSTYNVTGTWKVLDESKRTYEVRWSGGRFVDTLTLSEDGDRLTGSNQYGTQEVFTRRK